MSFPPKPVYPLAIDNDKTLFLVYNTTETIITVDNPAWAEEIAIRPQPADQPEIWADNGFATINGELLYYDAVQKVNGRVSKLKKCDRQLGGEVTRYNVVGTDIRSFVIAEHHTQLVAAIENVEEFVGVQNSDDPLSLDYRIRQIADQADCIDDSNCPDVSFHYSTDTSNEQSNRCLGTTINYDLTINGGFNTFKLDFGDGNTTNSIQSGSHTYAPNVKIDPVIFIANDTCQIMITGIERDDPKEPKPVSTTTPLRIIVPDPGPFPEINLPDIPRIF